MDEITTTPKLKHNATLMRFYDWVKQWRDRLPFSHEHKPHQIIGKKPEQNAHDHLTF